MKKAIFGGSFDPPHVGHLETIKQAIISLNIDELIVVPAFLSPFKSQYKAPSHLRLKWLRTMTEKMPKVRVSSFEIELNRSVPSIETVRHLKKEDEIYFIIGADNLKDLSLWKNFEELDKMVTWVIATRNETAIPQKYQTLNVRQDISATELRNSINEKYLDDSVKTEIIDFYQQIDKNKDSKMEKRLEKITACLDHNKAEAIETFDLTGKDYIVDQVVIATSLNSRHTEALLNYLKNELKPAETFLGTDVSDEWVVADLGDILIHIMTAEYRTRYNMEEFLGEVAANKKHED